MLCTLFASTKTNAAFEMCTFHFTGLDFVCKIWNKHKPNESVNMGKESNSHGITLVREHVLRFIVSLFSQS